MATDTNTETIIDIEGMDLAVIYAELRERQADAFQLACQRGDFEAASRAAAFGFNYKALAFAHAFAGTHSLAELD